MREIKFRIWNTTRKEFAYLELFSTGKSNIHTSPDVERSSNFKDLEQFIVLKDKTKRR